MQLVQLLLTRSAFGALVRQWCALGCTVGSLCTAYTCVGLEPYISEPSPLRRGDAEPLHSSPYYVHTGTPRLHAGSMVGEGWTCVPCHPAPSRPLPCLACCHPLLTRTPR
ncbi:Uncharacterized protein TCM_028946 [Theobroma cacao]|uniref:Uncharacterized protein n=1 Tax=Theobroma cacao TaxID=3641 RepID=A0A061GCU8_THECC|nr:Uncharacterized protein TCM_028946 [Theobroma cacao]